MAPRPLGSQPRQNRVDRLLRSMVPRLNRPTQPHRLTFRTPRRRRPIDHPARCRRRDLPLRLTCRNVAAHQHVTSTASSTVRRRVVGAKRTPHPLFSRVRSGDANERPTLTLTSGHLNRRNLRLLPCPR